MNHILDLKDIFERQGIFVSEEDYSETLAVDSLQFISLIVEIEEHYSIEIDDTYLTQTKLQSFNDFLNLIETILELNKNEGE